MAANKFSGMGSSDDRNVREIQENIRILQDRVIGLENQTTTQVTAPKSDAGNNFVRKDLNQLRWEFDHLRIPEGGGDTYAGLFRVYQTAAQSASLTVTVDAGRFVYGTGSTVINGGTEVITATTNTYYLYFEASYSAGLVTAITHSSTYPAQSATHERVVLAEIDVAASIVSAVRQIQFGEIHSTRIWS